MNYSPSPNIRLHLNQGQTLQGLKYQVLSIEITSQDRIIEPQDLVDLELPPGIDTTGGVVISGRAPIWLYAYLVHELNPISWVACYDPRIGAVVTRTYTRLVKVGQVIPIKLLKNTAKEGSDLCPALVVVGPPDSGKSLLSYALFKALLPENPEIFLQRAHWDGEGNSIMELEPEATQEEIEAFKATYRGCLTERFFPYHAQAILQLRRQKALVIVDIGGMARPEKQPILEACSHYVIISSKPEEVELWHEFCRDRGNLMPVAVIHSRLQECEIVHHYSPYLEVTCGPWIRGQTLPIPVPIMERVRRLARGTAEIRGEMSNRTESYAKLG